MLTRNSVTPVCSRPSTVRLSSRPFSTLLHLSHCEPAGSRRAGEGRLVRARCVQGRGRGGLRGAGGARAVQARAQPARQRVDQLSDGPPSLLGCTRLWSHFLWVHVAPSLELQLSVSLFRESCWGARLRAQIDQDPKIDPNESLQLFFKQRFTQWYSVQVGARVRGLAGRASCLGAPRPDRRPPVWTPSWLAAAGSEHGCSV